MFSKRRGSLSPKNPPLVTSLALLLLFTDKVMPTVVNDKGSAQAPWAPPWLRPRTLNSLTPLCCSDCACLSLLVLSSNLLYYVLSHTFYSLHSCFSTIMHRELCLLQRCSQLYPGCVIPINFYKIQRDFMVFHGTPTWLLGYYGYKVNSAVSHHTAKFKISSMREQLI